MDVATKLQIPADASVAVLGLPDGVDLGVTTAGADAETARAAIAFVTLAAELDGPAAQAAMAAARRDAVAWIAYPKAGGLGTDLNRDRLAALVSANGLRPVRQVAIDEVWSALRFRPA